MKSINLSKSSFVKGLQCFKQLYLYKNHYDQMDPVPDALQAVFSTGHQVGELATQLFPGGLDVSKLEEDYGRQVERTRELLASGAKIIYEAAFSVGKVFVRVDILRLGPEGWEIYEVKSSTSVSEVYRADLAVQYRVVEGAGLQVARACLVHIDRSYVRDGEIEVDKLFTIVDLTDEVRGRQDWVAEQVAAMQAMLRRGEMPEIAIGPHCKSPYKCAFYGTCHKDIPTPSVFDLADRGKPEAYDLYHRGIVAFEDIPLDELGWRQRLQVESFLDKSSRVDRDAVQKFLDGLHYPLAFLDFETLAMVAVPVINGTRPYQTNIPFQYSLHLQRTADAPLEHFEYLAGNEKDPRELLAERLLADLPEDACILAYNASVEAGCMKHLAEHVPNRATELLQRVANLRDLMTLFARKQVYHWAMQGSYSIKKVLPALLPELSYADMEIGDGMAAANAYLAMREGLPAEQVEVLRRNLLDYCRLDTLAMVRLLEKLRELVG